MATFLDPMPANENRFDRKLLSDDEVSVVVAAAVGAVAVVVRVGPVFAASSVFVSATGVDVVGVLPASDRKEDVLLSSDSLL